MDTPRHTCPVCGTRHAVHPVLHRLAYGKQLTCSPRCRMDFRVVVRTRLLADMERQAVSPDLTRRAA